MSAQDIYNAIRIFDEEYIPFPPFDVALQVIDKSIIKYRETGIADKVIISGESGSGKSTLCEIVKRQFPRTVLFDRDLLPALIVSVPPAATIASVAEAMLHNLGDPAPLKGNISGKTNRVITLCKACKVEVVLLDEAQHINDRGRYFTQYMVGDWLKSLIDQLKVPIFLLGLPRLERLLQVNEQLRRRFSKRLSLALGQGGSETLHTECFQLFNTLGSVLPLPISFSPYGWQELGLRIYYASDGRVHYIKQLMQSALETALENGEPQLCPALFEQAFTDAIWSQGVGALNPFNPAFEYRRLDRGNEPFQNGNNDPNNGK
jgi:adenylate kinase family enzyme